MIKHPSRHPAGISRRGGIIREGGIIRKGGIQRTGGAWRAGLSAEQIITSTNPYLWIDAFDSMLATGGGQAGFLASVPTFDNLATGSNAGSDATQATAAQQGRALPLIDGQGYLYLPGISGNTPAFGFAPLTAGAWAITVCATLEKWSGHTDEQAFASNGATDFIFRLTTTGALQFFSGSPRLTGSTPVPFADGTKGWVRLTHDGSGTYETSYSTDGVNYVPNGSVTDGPFSPAFSAVAFGRHSAIGDLLIGALHSCEWVATNTSLVIDWEKTTYTHNQTAITADTGQTGTVFQSGGSPSTLVRVPSGRMDGVDDTYAATMPIDVGSQTLISCYTDMTTGTRGVRESTVTSSDIMSTSGTTLTISPAAALDMQCAVIIPSTTPAAQKTAVIDALVSKFSAANLT